MADYRELYATSGAICRQPEDPRSQPFPARPRTGGMVLPQVDTLTTARGAMARCRTAGDDGSVVQHRRHTVQPSTSGMALCRPHSTAHPPGTSSISNVVILTGDLEFVTPAVTSPASTMPRQRSAGSAESRGNRARKKKRPACSRPSRAPIRRGWCVVRPGNGPLSRRQGSNQAQQHHAPPSVATQPP